MLDGGGAGTHIVRPYGFIPNGRERVLRFRLGAAVARRLAVVTSAWL